MDCVLASAELAPANKTSASPLSMLSTPRTAPKAATRFNDSVRLATFYLLGCPGTCQD